MVSNKKCITNNIIHVQNEWDFKWVDWRFEQNDQLMERRELSHVSWLWRRTEIKLIIIEVNSRVIRRFIKVKVVEHSIEHRLQLICKDYSQIYQGNIRFTTIQRICKKRFVLIN